MSEPFPLVEALRRQVRATKYTPVDDAELTRMCRSDAMSVHNDRIEGIQAHPQDRAFWAMLREERVPAALCETVLRRYLSEALGRNRRAMPTPPNEAPAPRR